LGNATGKEKSMAGAKKPPAKPVDQGKVRLYTLEVFLLSGPISASFAKKNRVISRTIQIRGDQTLEHLHEAIFDAFGRWEEHMYEFQFGKGPMDPKGPKYGLRDPDARRSAKKGKTGCFVDDTTIDSLGLEVGRSFGYWFDFGDSWWHQINVEAIEDKVPREKLPKVIKRVGKSPPQYPEEDE
jgi:Plasmid pRiA4b ORF-3-like protein